MIYRQLKETEFHKVEHLFEERGQTPPTRMNAHIYVAEDGDRIVGMIVLQVQLHAEPIWIDKDYRGKFPFTALVKKMEQSIPEGTPYYAFAPTEKIGRMAAAVGMRDLGWEVWMKEVR